MKTLSLSPSNNGFLARLSRRFGLKMAWNEPGNSGNGKDDKKKDPWSGQNQDGPPDLDEAIKKMQQKFGGLFGKKGGGGNGLGGGSSNSSGGFGFYASIIAVLIFAWLAYEVPYQIKEAERGVVLRFGRHVDTLQSGLNLQFPRPIDRVYKVDVSNIYNFVDKSRMLTADENLVEVELFIQYQINKPEDFLFNIRWPNKSVDVVLRSVMESSVRDVIGKAKMDFVLSEGRADISSRTKQLMQEILDEYESGLLISELKLRDARPPEAVKAAFDDAIKAREDEERAKNEAEAYANDIIPKARGKAARDVADATAYKAQVVDEAKGDASRFEQLLAEYEKAPKVTRDRLYLETVESVLANNQKIMIDVDSGNNLMYLPLDKVANQAAAAAAASQPTHRVESPMNTRRDGTPFRDNSRGGSRR